MSIGPFRGRLVKADRVDDVLAPAYDSLTSEQRRQYRQAHPLCYLHVTRSAPDEPDGDQVDNATLVARGRASLETLLASDALAPAADPALLVYELTESGHRQRGVVGEVPAAEFAERARPHEDTQADRTALLADHFETVRAASSPVAVTVSAGSGLGAALDQVADTTEPVIDHQGQDGLRQRVWRVADPELGAAIIAAVGPQPLYLVDGHHRAAANAALADRGIDVPLLAVVFPSSALKLAGFHRLVNLPDGLDQSALLQLIEHRFSVTTTDAMPALERGGVVIRTDTGWHSVRFDERPISGSPLVRLGSLDPVVLEREILGLVESRYGPVQVSFMSGEEDVARVADYAAASGLVPFLVPPLHVGDMIEVADGGLIMPPKSTYFVPKVRAGLFVRLY